MPGVVGSIRRCEYHVGKGWGWGGESFTFVESDVLEGLMGRVGRVGVKEYVVVLIGDMEMRMLEIGVGFDASLRQWVKYIRQG